MPPQEFHQTLSRFGLENLKDGLDLVTEGGDIAVTRDGDLKLGTSLTNGMFRFIERWRQSESAITELFGPMVQAAAKLEVLLLARERGEEPTLSQNPVAYHDVTDSIVEAQLVCSTLAGSIAVIQNSLFHRLKADINASNEEWRQAGLIYAGFSIGEIFSAAAANFRHYDEWASAKSPSTQQLVSMRVLCGLLNMPVETAQGLPTIRTNVCGRALMQLSQGSIEEFHQLTVGFAKSLAKFK